MTRIHNTVYPEALQPMMSSTSALATALLNGGGAELPMNTVMCRKTKHPGGRAAAITIGSGSRGADVPPPPPLLLRLPLPAAVAAARLSTQATYWRRAPYHANPGMPAILLTVLN